MKVLIIGLGSIASKHILAIQEIDSSCELYALRSKPKPPQHDGVKSIFHWENIPTDLDFVIISNPTHLHAQTITKALELNKPLFIEKPPVAHLAEWVEIKNLLTNHRQLTYCGFLLRFHPVIEWLKENVNIKDVLEFHAYCGSYLPDWRTNGDYSQSYSAKKNQGGGVHLDLIHEIDYIIWLFGPPVSSQGYVKKISSLNIDSFDTAHYFLSYEHAVGSVDPNYYSKTPKRTLNLVFENKQWTIDLLKNTIADQNGKLLYSSKTESSDLIKKQMIYFIDCIQRNKPVMNSFENTYETMKTCLNIKEL